MMVAHLLLDVPGTVGPGVRLVSCGSTQLTHDLSQVWTNHHSSLSQLVTTADLNWSSTVDAESTMLLFNTD